MQDLTPEQLTELMIFGQLRRREDEMTVVKVINAITIAANAVIETIASAFR